jgi:hypothetical protein
MQPENFSKIFQKKGIWTGTNTQKKLFLNFFLRFLGGLCTDTKCEKVVLFGFSTGTESEKLKFYSSNIQYSHLVPVLNQKSTTFSHLVSVKDPQKIEEKKLKKKMFFLVLHLVLGTTFKKNFFKTGSTKYQMQIPVLY